MPTTTSKPDLTETARQALQKSYRDAFYRSMAEMGFVRIDELSGISSAELESHGTWFSQNDVGTLIIDWDGRMWRSLAEVTVDHEVVHRFGKVTPIGKNVRLDVSEQLPSVDQLDPTQIFMRLANSEWDPAI